MDILNEMQSTISEEYVARCVLSGVSIYVSPIKPDYCTDGYSTETLLRFNSIDPNI